MSKIQELKKEITENPVAWLERIYQACWKYAHRPRGPRNVTFIGQSTSVIEKKLQKEKGAIRMNEEALRLPIPH